MSPLTKAAASYCNASAELSAWWLLPVPDYNTMAKSRREIPAFSQPIIETHCHLDYLDAETLDDTLARSAQLNIVRLITIAVSADNLDTVIKIARQHSNIWCTQGIHPHEAAQYTAGVDATIRTNLTNDKVIAVGEIGLDYYYEHSDRATQRRVFEQQLDLAAGCAYPVVIHTRDADEDTRAILSNFSSVLPCKGVIHSFTAGQDLAEFCLAEGFSLGFNGITTFNKAENVRDIVRLTPVERILLETDSPYLTPVPYRGQQNAPYFLPFIAEKIAELKEMPVEVLLQQVYRNSIELFFPAEQNTVIRC